MSCAQLSWFHRNDDQLRCAEDVLLLGHEILHTQIFIFSVDVIKKHVLT